MAEELCDEGIVQKKPTPPPRSLSTNYKDMSIEFFITHHVILPTAQSKGYLDCTLRLLDSHDNKSSMSPLTSAVRAVGLATYANIVRSPDLLQGAMMDYTNALRLTNMSLSKPTEATKETVLLSVILLGLFENITCTGNKNLIYWNNHVKGSLQLLYLRGKRQFDTPDGVQMWHLLTANIISSCIQRECRVPESLRKLRQYVTGTIDTTSFHWRLVEIMIRFANLNADAEHSKLSGLNLIDTAAAIDEQFVAHFTKPNLLGHMDFYNITAADAPTELVYENVYSIYRDWTLASMWNHMRIARMYIQQIMLCEIDRVLSSGRNLAEEKRCKLQEDLTRIAATVKQLALDVCASVPQLAGYESTLGSPPPPELGARSHQTHSAPMYSEAVYRSPVHEQPPNLPDDPYSSLNDQAKIEAESFILNPRNPNSTASMSLLWPLYQVGCMKFVPAKMKSWAINRLDYVGRKSGLGQALTIANALRARGKITMYRDESGWGTKRGMDPEVPGEIEELEGVGTEIERENILYTETELGIEV